MMIRLYRLAISICFRPGFLSFNGSISKSGLQKVEFLTERSKRHININTNTTSSIVPVTSIQFLTRYFQNSISIIRGQPGFRAKNLIIVAKQKRDLG